MRCHVLIFISFDFEFGYNDTSFCWHFPRGSLCYCYHLRVLVTGEDTQFWETQGNDLHDRIG